jgi:hypothetical protein
MTTLRYALHPDYVRSRTDGDVHYIPARELAFCYGLQFGEYLIVNDAVDRWLYADQMRRAEELGLIHLYPRYDGNYKLPHHAQETHPQ